MIYIEGLFAFIAVSTALYVFLYNLFFRFRYVLNRLMALNALIIMSQFILFILMISKIPDLPNVMIARIFLSMILLLSICMFLQMSIFPDIHDRKHFLVYLLGGIPGLIFIFIIITTDLVIKDIPFVGYTNRTLGPLYYTYILISAIYFSLSVIIVFIKSRIYSNRFLKKEMGYYLLGFGFTVLYGIILIALLPRFFGIDITRNIGTLLSGIFLLLIINAATTDVRRIDMRKFYIDMLFWIILALLLFIPVAAILKFTLEHVPPEPLSLVGIAACIYVYLFLFFKYAKPGLENFFERDYRNLTNEFDEFFKSLKKLDMQGDQETFWDKFYEQSIDGLIKQYDILGGNLFLYNTKKGSYVMVHSVGEAVDPQTIESDSNLASCLTMESGILTTSILYMDQRYKKYRDDVLQLFNNNTIDIAIPFFGLEKKLIGFLLLGMLKNRKTYSKTFVSGMELFRIQFQHQLANALILEDIKKSQVISHDNLVVESIKKKIIPRELKQIPGFRISSFNINNSAQGGDYFDSIFINENKIAVFITDTSYAGVDSAILALEIYTAFNTPIRLNDSPDKILNTMNWIISTSKYEKKYAPSLCLTYTSKGELEYSNAAFNPLLLYDIKKDTFTELDSRGIPVGVDKDFLYETKQVPVHQGTIGIMYSDGLVSAMNSSGESYGTERIQKIIQSTKEKSPAIMTRELYLNLTAFIGGHKQINDITCIIFKI